MESRATGIAHVRRPLSEVFMLDLCELFGPLCSTRPYLRGSGNSPLLDDGFSFPKLSISSPVPSLSHPKNYSL